MTRRSFLGQALAASALGGCRSAQTPEAAADGVFDVIVAGGGPAGVSTALAAAKAGARVHVFESHGCLGGIWTSGLLACIIGFDRSETDREIVRRLKAYGSHLPRKGSNPNGNFLCEPEYMKAVLEDLCAEAGVTFTYHCPVVAANRDGREIASVVTESKSGRQTWRAKVFVDTTGDGDLAARAGCGFDLGITPDGCGQPASLMSIVSTPDYEKLRPFVLTDPMNWSADDQGRSQDTQRVTRRTLEACHRAGIDPSYSRPSLFRLHGNLLQFAVNHEYKVRVDDAQAITEATVRARREHLQVVTALAKLGGPWEGLRLVATAEQIGQRSARRIHGRYVISREDVAAGRRFDDAVCRSFAGIDLHALDRKANETRPSGETFGNRFRPFDVPLGACRAKDVDNLFMAGRCISGDFIAQASYRMTGCAVGMGEAVGRAAAELAAQRC